MRRMLVACVAGLSLAWLGTLAMAAQPPQPAPPPVAIQPAAALPDLPPAPIPVTAPVPAPEPDPKLVPPPVTAPPSGPAPEVANPHPPETEVLLPGRVPEFFGDQAPIGSLLTLPVRLGNGQSAIYVPSARYFKISDDESPRPQNRSYFSFNYFYNLFGSVNDAAGGGIQHTRIHREIWGVEWADHSGHSSVGLRLPLDTYNAANTVPGLDGTSTDIGDLSIIFKELLWEDAPTGSLLSVGLAVTPPTGPGSFAGSNNLKVFHNTTLQPFCGWIWSRGSFYMQGFTAVDAPTDLNDVVMLSNDLAIGYFLFQSHRHDGLTAVVPTVEVHVNTPLNHRGVLSFSDPAGNPDMIDLTGGIHFEHRDRSSLGVAFVVPLTGPRMFDFEILAQLRWRY